MKQYLEHSKHSINLSTNKADVIFLHMNTNVRINLEASIKKSCKILIGISLNLYAKSERIGMLILSIAIHKYDISSFIRCALISLSNVL